MRTDKALVYDFFGMFIAYFVMSMILFFALEQNSYELKNVFLYARANFEKPTSLLWICLGSGLAVALTWIWFNPFTKLNHEYGDAAWAKKADVKKMGLYAETGVILGQAFGNYLRTDKPLSIMLFAPPGTGKTAGVVIPTLFSCGNSLIIFDVKGELYNITSKRRSEFSKVIRFALGEEDSACWNPLAKECLPERWADIEIKIDRISSVIYATDSKDHWATEAKPLFQFFALYLIHKHGGTSIPEVRSFALSAGGEPQEFIAQLLDENEGTLPPRILEEGNGALAKADKEFAGVFSSFKAALNAFADPYLKRTLGSNDFVFSEFRKERHSVYLIVKAEDVERLAPVVRLFFEELSLYILSVAPEKDSHTVTMVIDEMPRLGKLDQVINAPALMRGNRGNVLMIAQDYDQIKEVYGPTGPGKVNGTVAYRIILAQNNFDSAESISKHIGDATRKKESVSTSAGQLMGTVSTSTEGFKLASSQFLMSMKEEDCIVISQNYASRPIFGQQVRWYKDKIMKKLAGEYKPVIDVKKSIEPEKAQDPRIDKE